jgi:hypothetical protein
VKDDSHAGVVWLDSRDYSAKQTYRLMSAAIDGAGVVSDETTIDDDVCTCCPTSMIKTQTGLLAAYRNHNQQEIRDTFMVRQHAGSWQGGQPLGNESWHINACPVNGPVLARNGNDVVAVWFTGMEEQASVKAAFSADGGLTFGKPFTVDNANDKSAVLGKAAVAMLDSGSAIISWIRRQDGKSKLVIARLRPNRDGGEHRVVAEGSTDSLGYPHMQQVNKDGALVSWGGMGDSKIIKTSLIEAR